jgi:TetR/AcrR family transcriptional regulator, transcriptional repressor for nem operon
MSKGEKTRQRIVAEAAALFNQRGFEGGSMTDLMEATGLEKGGIYRHFSSKEELAAEAFDYAWRLATQVRVHDLDSVPNSIDKLKRFIANFVECRPAIPGGCPLLKTAVDTNGSNSVLRERARQALRQWQDILSEIITAGIERNEIRSDIAPGKLATFIIGSLEGAMMISMLERDRTPMREARSHLERYLEDQISRSTQQSAISTPPAQQFGAVSTGILPSQDGKSKESRKAGVKRQKGNQTR